MNKSVRYPVEAFAVAMIMFTSGMKTAMLVGITVIFGDVLLYVLKENLKEAYKESMAALSAVAFVAAAFGMFYYAGLPLELNQLPALAVIGVLLIKHHEKPEMEEFDYNEILFKDSIAYAGMVGLAIIREYLAKAAIMDFELGKAAAVSGAYGKPMFALVGTGLMLALLNRILKVQSEESEVLWVALPVIVLEAPFVLRNVDDKLGTIIGIAFMMVAFITFSRKLKFSESLDHIKGVPVSVVTLGMMYMIFSIL